MCIRDSLKALQQAVGGSIGASYPFADDPVAVVYNDDGKLMGLPLNRALWEMCIRDSYYTQNIRV